MKIYRNDEFVKVVPKKYKPIEKQILKLVGTTRKALGKNERESLETAYKKYMFDKKVNRNIHKDLPKPIEALLKGKEFKGVCEVHQREGEMFYEVLFNGAPSLRVTATIGKKLGRWAGSIGKRYV